MWESSGCRQTERKGSQSCSQPDQSHTVSTLWGFFLLRSPCFKIPPWAQSWCLYPYPRCFGGTGDHEFLEPNPLPQRSQPLDGSQSGRCWAAAQFHTPKPSRHLLRYYYFSLIKWGIAGNYTVGPIHAGGVDGWWCHRWESVLEYRVNFLYHRSRN